MTSAEPRIQISSCNNTPPSQLFLFYLYQESGGVNIYTLKQHTDLRHIHNNSFSNQKEHWRNCESRTKSTTPYCSQSFIHLPRKCFWVQFLRYRYKNRSAKSMCCLQYITITEWVRPSLEKEKKLSDRFHRLTAQRSKTLWRRSKSIEKPRCHYLLETSSQFKSTSLALRRTFRQNTGVRLQCHSNEWWVPATKLEHSESKNAIYKKSRMQTVSCCIFMANTHLTHSDSTMQRHFTDY